MTRPDPNSNRSYIGGNTRKPYPEQTTDPILVQIAKHTKYFNHYYSWLQRIAYQLYEWNVPKELPKNLIEVYLHEFGQVAFVDHEEFGKILLQGVASGVGNYYYPTEFTSNDKFYLDVKVPLYYYGRETDTKRGAMVTNHIGQFSTDMIYSSSSIFQLYAEQLAFIKQLSDINLNAQKTPVIMMIDDTIRTQQVEELYTKVDGNSPVIFTRKILDENGNVKIGGQMKDMITTLKTDAPFLLDKLETQKQKVWDEAMACLGLMNMAQYKKERMTKTESEANEQQVFAVQNSLLQARIEGCELINTALGWNVSVKPSVQKIQTEGGEYTNEPLQEK